VTKRDAVQTGTVVGPKAPHSELAGILLESLTALAAAGAVEEACRLAGRACVASRRSDEATARRFDVLLHRLTPKLTW
jgi:hypothetical protein